MSSHIGPQKYINTQPYLSDFTTVINLVKWLYNRKSSFTNNDGISSSCVGYDCLHESNSPYIRDFVRQTWKAQLN